MLEQRIEASAAPDVKVETCTGNLRVKSGEEGEIRLLRREGDEAASVDREGERLVITIPSDATLVCPPRTRLAIERALKNLTVERMVGPMTIGTVHGNTRLEDVGAVTVRAVSGNLTARGVSGDLAADDVKGNARLHGVSGRLALQRVAGNLTTEGAQGGVEVERVWGNVSLGPGLMPGSPYRVKASGNLTLVLPSEPNTRLSLRAAGRVRSDVPGLSLEQVDGEVEATLGDGEAAVEADVDGNVVVRSAGETEPFATGAGLAELGAQIEWQVNEAMADLAARLESRLGSVEPDRVRRRVEKATEQARRKAEQAAERARMRAEKAERRWQRASGQRPRLAETSVSDEERLRVLRMVEEGRLTPDQASDLLSALEGS